MTYTELHSSLAKLIGISVDELDPNANLYDYGLDSLQVFELVAAWREQGLKADLLSLAQEPTTKGWWQYLQKLRPPCSI